jgi:hypothetical protein
VSRLVFGAFAVLLWVGGSASAQVRASSPDLRYCAALSELYMRYVGNPMTEPRSIRRNDAEADIAVARCRDGNAAAAIPVLERKLIDNKFTLPARE